jgi:hypothetical protein
MRQASSGGSGRLRNQFHGGSSSARVSNISGGSSDQDSRELTQRP